MAFASTENLFLYLSSADRGCGASQNHPTPQSRRVRRPLPLPAWVNRAAHILCSLPEFFFDFEQTVVFRNALATARRSGFQLPSSNRNCEICKWWCRRFRRSGGSSSAPAKKGRTIPPVPARNVTQGLFAPSSPCTKKARMISCATVPTTISLSASRNLEPNGDQRRDERQSHPHGGEDPDILHRDTSLVFSDSLPGYDSATSLRLSGVISCTRLNGGNSGFGELLHREYRL
jgi:hypothetical protein